MEPRPRTDELAAGSDKETRGGPGRRRLWWAAGLAAGLVAVAVVRPDFALHAEQPGAAAAHRGADRRHGPGSRPSTVAWDTRGDLATDYGVRVRAPSSGSGRSGRRWPGSSSPAGCPTAAGWCWPAATTTRTPSRPPSTPWWWRRGSPVADAPVTELAALSDPQQVLAWAGRDRDGHVSAVAAQPAGAGALRGLPAGAASPTTAPPAGSGPRRTPRTGWSSRTWATEVDPVVTVRAIGPGVTPAAQVVRVVSATGRAGQRPLRIRGVDAPDVPRARPGPAGARAPAGGRGAWPTSASSQLRVLWSGALWKQRRLALVLVTRPDGVRLQALVGQQGELRVPVRRAGAAPRRAGRSCRGCWSRSRRRSRRCCSARPARARWSTAGPASRTAPCRCPRPGSRGCSSRAPTRRPPRGARVTLLDPQGQQLLSTVLPATGFDDPLALD